MKTKFQLICLSFAFTCCVAFWCLLFLFCYYRKPETNGDYMVDGVNDPYTRVTQVDSTHVIFSTAAGRCDTITYFKGE